MTTEKVVLGLSGGLDSTTLLGYLLEQQWECHCCIFSYGSTHGQYETQAAHNVVQHYQKHYHPVSAYNIDITAAMQNLKSNLLLSNNAEIPEGPYSAETMAQTVVPGRNLIFASIMSAVANSVEAQYVVLAVHAGDHAVYPDCRLEFIKALDTAVYLATDKTVQVWTPFAELSKQQILLLGSNLPATPPYQLTRSCYKNQAISCGVCSTCQQRQQAFSELGITDPVQYEYRG